MDGSAWTSGDCSRRVVREGSWDSTRKTFAPPNRMGIAAYSRAAASASAGLIRHLPGECRIGPPMGLNAHYSMPLARMLFPCLSVPGKSNTLTLLLAPPSSDRGRARLHAPR